jgi:hypothetical protein
LKSSPSRIAPASAAPHGQARQLARPVVRRRTRFQPDHTARNAAEERQHLPAPHSLAQNRRTLRINAVNLKNILG